jgi:hypothetical protein
MTLVQVAAVWDVMNTTLDYDSPNPASTAPWLEKWQLSFPSMLDMQCFTTRSLCVLLRYDKKGMKSRRGTRKHENTTQLMSSSFVKLKSHRALYTLARMIKHSSCDHRNATANYTAWAKHTWKSVLIAGPDRQSCWCLQRRHARHKHHRALIAANFWSWIAI